MRSVQRAHSRLSRRCALRVACTLALVASAPAWAVAPARYETVAASPDGIGKRYMGREIEQVMGWQGAAWLERSEREQEERTDLLLSELLLVAGMSVADIRAGTGYIARPTARLVGAHGIVYAVTCSRRCSACCASSSVPRRC